MYRFISGSWKPVESKYTDITGKVQFSYLPYTNYKFFLSRSGYVDYVFYLNPILFSTYDIAMTKSTTLNQSQDFDRISIIYSPTLFFNNNLTEFNWIIASPYGELVEYGFTLTYPGGTSTVTDVNAIGSQLSATISITNATVFDTVKLTYFYETSTVGFRNYTFYYPIFINQAGNFTFQSNRNETFGMGVFERIFVVTIILIFIVGIASLVGKPIAGLAIGLFVLCYMVYIGFITIWLILPSMLIGLIFLMWKSGG
jgi:hypothetical protein